MNQAKLDLCEFIVHTYPKRGLIFSTSWTNESLYETEEERLINACFVEDDNRDWYEDLPSVIFDLATEWGAQEREQTDLFAMFLGDAMRDLFNCNMREDF
jgi:hypothetical protein